MGKILITVAEDREKSTADNMAIIHHIDDGDCIGFASGLKEAGYEALFANWDDYDQARFNRVYNVTTGKWEEVVDPAVLDLVFFYKMEGFLTPERREEFLKMVNQVSRETMVINNPETIRGNMSKTYLKQLASSGIPVVPTFTVDEALDTETPSEGYVVKPWISERGNGQYRVSDKEALIQLAREMPSIRNSHLVQPFEPGIANGEVSMVFLDLEYQHAAKKTPREGEYRVNDSRGGRYVLHDSTQDEINLGIDTLVNYPTPVFYSRIDLIRDAETGKIMVSEAECLNPSVYAGMFGLVDEFGRNFAQHVDRLVGGEHVRIAV